MTAKSTAGRYFEDFRVGETIVHPTPRTLTAGDTAVYVALTGDRAPLHCDAEFARALGYRRETIHDLLVFHVVFGKSVPDVSLNAIANLGYADLRFLRPVYPGDTLRAQSEVIGLRPASAGDAGVVWVRTRGLNQRGEAVLEFVRWVLVNKRDRSTAASELRVPELPERVSPERLAVPLGLRARPFPSDRTGGTAYWEDYEPGERIDHLDGMTLEETEHALATRLYQNTARVHFNAQQARASRFGRRLVYGGHVISLAFALARNGFANAIAILAFNAGTHANPTFAGDTLYAWSEVLERLPLPGREDAGALRCRLVAVKDPDGPAGDVPLRVRDERDGRERYHPSVVLDLDYTLLLPRRGG